MFKRIEPSSISIRPAAAEDLPGVAALAEVVWRAHYPGIISMAQIEYMLERMYDLQVMRQELDGGIRYDLALVEGISLAFASYGPVAAGELKLHKLYVHPDWHREGLGSRLLEHVEAQARGGGFPMVVLAVNKGNHKAVAAYQKNGFTIRQSVTTDIGGGFVMDDYIMAKRV